MVAHKFELQAFVALRKICFGVFWHIFVLGYFCTLKKASLAKKWGYRGKLGEVFGSKFEGFPITGKKSPIAETEALLGKNTPKLAQIRYVHNANFPPPALEDVLEG